MAHKTWPYSPRHILLGQMARYYDWYSNKSRGVRKKQGILKPGELPVQKPVNIEIIDVSDYQPPRMPSKK